MHNCERGKFEEITRDVPLGPMIHQMDRLMFRNLSARVRAAGLDEVTLMHGWVMRYLYENRDRVICQRDIEHTFEIRRSTVTNIIQLMEKKGYVERRSVPGDARLKCVSLTAKGEENDELNGFDLGVDEYISKPFSPKILVARVEAILRRSNNLSTGEVLKAGGIELDIAAHEVRIDGKEITLSFKEFELLNYFVVNQGVALSREKILNNVWNYDYFGDARTIDTHVKKLRSKLGDKGEYIKTIWGMGYKFEVD